MRVEIVFSGLNPCFEELKSRFSEAGYRTSLSNGATAQQASISFKVIDDLFDSRMGGELRRKTIVVANGVYIPSTNGELTIPRTSRNDVLLADYASGFLKAHGFDTK